jgi:ABC-2 type transport system ATP-binding protein
MTFGASSVTVEFDDHIVLQDVTLDAPRGSITAVVGGDGAGKTTLLRCFAGLVRPTRGTIAAPGKQALGYMPSTSGTWRDLTVDENLDVVERVFGLAQRGSGTPRRELLLARAGLADARHRLAGQLSGGMRQKLGFCLTIVHEPTLLVLDEPSTGVDAVSRLELWQLVADQAAAGAAVLMATTYLDEAERASRVLLLDAGVTLASGAPREIIEREAPRVIDVDRPTHPGLAWRRGRRFREWRPGTASLTGTPANIDLEDAVMAAILRAQHADDATRQ